MQHDAPQAKPITSTSTDGADNDAAAAVAVRSPQTEWEARRKDWLTETGRGCKRSSEDTVRRLEKLLHPKNKGDTFACDRAIMGIVQKFGDKRPLKEPLPLAIITPLLFRSWIVDGTIPAEMLQAGREGTDVEDNAAKE